MSTAEKIKTPEEMYEEYRQISIDANNYFIESTEKLLSNFYKNNIPLEETEKALKVSNQNFSFAYRSFPYVKILFEWEYKNFPLEDLQLFPQYIPNLYEYEETIIRIYLRTLDLYTKSLEEYDDNPEKAEKPLTAEENKLFCYFLENIVKPATTNFINSIKEGNYRSIREIDNDKTSMQRESIDVKALSKLNEELERPSRDIFLYLKIYSTDCNFPQIIADTFKGIFKISEVFEVSKLEMPLDKINRNIWKFPISPRAPITFAMENEADERKGREVNLVYSIDFSALEENGNVKITKKLTPFDKRVYAAIGAIYNAGNFVTSLTQIYTAMGNISKPSKDNLEKINNSITKMSRAVIKINNDEEADAYNYASLNYDGILLPMERISEVDIKGKTTKAAIHILREPPMISFAKGHGNQLTTVPIKLLQSPLSMTDKNLQLEDYLIERISKAKKGKLSNKIKFETLFKELGVNDANTKQRLPEKIERFLNHCKKNKYIKEFSLNKEAIVIDV